MKLISFNKKKGMGGGHTKTGQEGEGPFFLQLIEIRCSKILKQLFNLI